MTPQLKKEIRSVGPEIGIYALLVGAYCWAVFHFLADDLRAMARVHRVPYGLTALSLMIVQAFVLEWIARRIWRLVRPRPTKGSG